VLSRGSKLEQARQLIARVAELLGSAPVAR